MLIVCGGMIRSGSTLQYNLVKDLVTFAGGQHIHGNDNIPMRIREANNNRSLWYAHKTHVCRTDLFCDAHVTMTYRDIRDVVVSTMRFRKRSFDSVLSTIRDETVDRELVWIKSFPSSRLRRVRYENFSTDILPETIAIDKFLGLGTPELVIEEIAKQNSISNTKKRLNKLNNMDAHTRYGPNHIHSGAVGQWESELSDSQIEAVENEVGDWLIENDYELWSK